MPNGICRTEDDVIRHVKSMDYQQECRNTKVMIKDRYLEYGGNATEMCVDYLFK